jgi:hypothetical protein
MDPNERMADDAGRDTSDFGELLTPGDIEREDEGTLRESDPFDDDYVDFRDEQMFLARLAGPEFERIERGKQWKRRHKESEDF